MHTGETHTTGALAPVAGTGSGRATRSSTLAPRPAIPPRGLAPASGGDSAPVGHLLVAEDEPLCQRNVVAILSSAGYWIDAVADGAAAVAATGVSHYDAIVMDCRMPVMNGYYATTTIRAQEGHRRHTPIIGLAVGSRPEDRERCLAFGMDAYLAKPVGIDALLALVASFVDTWPQCGPQARDRRGLAVVPLAGDDLGSSGEAADPGPGARILPLSGATTRLPALDHQVLDELDQLDNGHGLVDELATLFLTDTLVQLAVLEDALAIEDSDTVGRVAHRLKGSAGNLGVAEFARLCALLPPAGSPLDPAVLAPVLAAMRSELTRVQAAFTQRAAGR